MLPALAYARRSWRVFGGATPDAYAIGGASPELVAAFLTQADGTTAGEYFRKASSETTFGDLFTFSRSGTATYFDSNGTLQTAADGVARRNAYYYNSGWELAGMQMEAAAATNLTTYSNDLTQTDWTKASATATATSLTDSAGTGLHYAYVSTSLTGHYTLSFVVSNVTNNKVWAYIRNLSTALAFFDVNTGTVGTISGSSTPTAGMIPWGAGKYLCWISANATVTAYGIGLTDGTEVTSYTASGSDGADIEDVQFEAGAIPTSRIPTTGSSATRAAETLSIAAADLPYSATGMFGYFKGLSTFLDNNGTSARFMGWVASSNDYLAFDINSAAGGTGAGAVSVRKSGGGAPLALGAVSGYTPGVLVPINSAFRVTGSVIQVADEGNAGSEVALEEAPTGIPVLSAANMGVGNIFNGFISEIRLASFAPSEAEIESVTS